jgi:hypothetical protein
VDATCESCSTIKDLALCLNLTIANIEVIDSITVDNLVIDITFLEYNFSSAGEFIEHIESFVDDVVTNILF